MKAGEPVSAALPLTPSGGDRGDTELGARWRTALWEAQEALCEALRRRHARYAQNYAIVAGLCQDKWFLLEGRPTSAILNLHEHRHELDGLLERFLAAKPQDALRQVAGKVLSSRALTEHVR